MPSDERRAALAAAQRELLAALVAGADAPPGFDAGRLRVQARALLDKRARGTAAHHPWLAEALGAGYLPRFTEYARGRPRPAGSGGHADALAFEAFLRDRGGLPDRPRTRSGVVGALRAPLRGVTAFLRPGTRPPTPGPGPPAAG